MLGVSNWEPRRLSQLLDGEFSILNLGNSMVNSMFLRSLDRTQGIRLRSVQLWTWFRCCRWNAPMLEGSYRRAADPKGLACDPQCRRLLPRLSI